jgi:hypothetical protein
VGYWPVVNLDTGIVDQKLTSLVPWRKLEMYTTLKYQDKDADAGAFTSTEITGVIRATTPDIILKSYQLRSQQWVIVLKERNGILWLVGNANNGATVRSAYDSNDSNRTLTLSFTWESEYGPYVYDPISRTNGDFSSTDYSIKDFF